MNKIQNLKEVELKEQNLFDLMHSALEIVNQIGEYTIFLVGLTRAGKSTCFHWILNAHYLIGKKNKKHQSCYVLNQNISTTAKVAQGYKSVTVLPNYGQIRVDGLVNDLLDMPGYEDTRSKDEVLGISYLIYQSFLKAKNMKFIIVIQEKNLLQYNGDRIMKTITGFLNMWRIKDMKQVDQNTFFDSVALLITTASLNHQDFQDILKSCIDFIAEVPSIQDKHLYIKLFTNIIKNKRYGCFPAAKINQAPSQIQILSIISKNNWKYMSNKIDMLVLPFDKDFDKLPPKQKDRLKFILERRLNAYRQLGKLLNCLLNQFLTQMKNINDYNKIFSKSEFQNQQKFLIQHSYYQDILNFTGGNQVLAAESNIDRMIQLAKFTNSKLNQ